MPIVGKRSLGTGVYKILNRRNGKVYIGSASITLKRRWNNHRSDLRLGKHPNKHLQRAWNKDGEAAFAFQIVEICPPEMCVEREQYWLDFYQSYKPEIGYNFCATAGSSLGTKHSPEARKKMRQIRLEKCQDPAERQRLSEQGKACWRDPVIREKFCEAIRKKFDDPEYLKRHGQVRAGKKRTPETRAKMRKSQLARWQERRLQQLSHREI